MHPDSWFHGEALGAILSHQYVFTYGTFDCASVGLVCLGFDGQYFGGLNFVACIAASAELMLG
jgi:hypothetical protein